MNAGKIVIAVLEKHKEGFLLMPVMEGIPLEQMRRQTSLFCLGDRAS